MPRKAHSWHGTSIPQDLWESVEKWLLSTGAKKWGYTSVTDFITDSVRRNIERVTGEPSI